jgi:hypothetical protein
MKSILLSAALAGGFAATSAEGAVEGQIVEASGVPVSGAIVLVSWHAYTGVVDTSKSCLHAERFTTGDDGRYKVPDYSAPFFSWGSKPWSDVRVFKSGWVPTHLPGPVPNGVAIKLSPDTDSADTRFNNLLQFISNMTTERCGHKDGSNGNLYKMHMALFEEAERLAPPAQAWKMKTVTRGIDLDLVDFRKEATVKKARDPNDDRVINVDPTASFDKGELLK